MKDQNKNAVSIIGGADGPTSVYLAGRTGKKPLKIRIWNYIYKCRGRRAAKRIVAGSHTLTEVIAYAKDTYHASECDTTKRKYVESQRDLNEHIIRMTKTTDQEITMDFHVYEIKVGDGVLDIEVDYIWEIFGVSYSGSKKVVKKLKKIAQDLYIYYGVTEEDIKNESERHSSLLAILST